MDFLFLLPIPILTSLLLHGCGGGGDHPGGGTTVPPSPPGPTTTSTTTTCIPVTGAGPEPELTLLQWNPHYQCSKNPACAGAVQGETVQRLQSEQVDFANLIEFPTQWIPPAPWKKIQKQCSLDVVALVYNSEKWTPSEVGRTGCITDKPDRPYIVQQFDGPGGSQVVVIGAHYQHQVEIGDLGKDARLVQDESKVTRLVFMADTNRFARGINAGTDAMCKTADPTNPSAPICQTNAEILEQINIHCSIQVVPLKPTQGTCCEPPRLHLANETVPLLLSDATLRSDRYTAPFDRIAATFGTSMELKTYDVPPTVAAEFHKAVLGKLRTKKHESTLLT